MPDVLALSSLKSVAVTGAAGFIGTRVCDLLERAGCRVLAIDNHSVGLPPLRPTALRTPLALDIRERARLRDAFAAYNPDVTLHLAAVHHIPTCEREPWEAFDVNVMGTQSVLEAIEASDCRGLVMASSGAVYDWCSGPLREFETPRHAHDVYATTKLANEYQVEAWTGRKSRRARMARLFNTIGTDDPNGHLIPDILSQIPPGCTACTIRLGNVDPKRDYVYVEDAAAGLLALVQGIDEGPAFDVFNICRGEDHSVADLVGLIGTVLGVAITIDQDPGRVRRVDRLQQLGDGRKMAEAHGWRAGHSLRDALGAMLREIDLGRAASSKG